MAVGSPSSLKTVENGGGHYQAVIGPRLLARVLLVMLSALGAAVGVFLVGDDAYLNNGTSRWSSRTDDPAAQATLWATAGIFLITVAVLVAAGRSGRRRLTASGTMLAVVTLVGLVFTLLAYAAN